MALKLLPWQKRPKISFLDLPDEIIEDILVQVTFNDRQSTRLVNKQLLRLNNIQRIAKGRKTVVDDYFHLGNYYTASASKIINLKIKIGHTNPCKQSETQKTEKFWEKHGKDITSLELLFYSRSYVHDIVLKVCQECPNLESLTVKLIFDSTEERQIDEFPAISTSNIKTLTLICSKKWNASDEDYENRWSPNLTPSSFPLSSILNALSANATNLQSLSIGIASFTPDKTKLIEYLTPKLDGPLRELDLKLSLSSDDIDLLFQKSNRLTKLNITSSDMGKELENLCVKSNDLRALTFMVSFQFVMPWFNIQFCVSQLAHLSHISLCHAMANDYIITSLNGLENLSCLELTKTVVASDKGIIGLFGSKCWPRMAHLHLSQVFNVTNQGIESILHNLPNITMLTLSECPVVSYKVLKTVFQHNHRIECLIINGMRDKERPHVIPEINNLTNLSHLDLEYDLGQLSGLNLPKLEILQAKSGTRSDFKVIFSKNCSLNYVILRDEDEFQDLGVVERMTHKAYNRMLRNEVMFSRQETHPCNFPRFYSLVQGPDPEPPSKALRFLRFADSFITGCVWTAIVSYILQMIWSYVLDNI